MSFQNINAGWIMDAEDSRIVFVSKNTSGDPTRIEWLSDQQGLKFKVRLDITYDVDGDPADLQWSLVDR